MPGRGTMIGHLLSFFFLRLGGPAFPPGRPGEAAWEARAKRSPPPAPYNGRGTRMPARSPSAPLSRGMEPASPSAHKWRGPAPAVFILILFGYNPPAENKIKIKTFS